MNLDPLDYDIHPEPLIIVISGPSGVGKDSVLKGLQARNLPLHFVITVNTRKRRVDERDGVDYFFITRERFAEMVANDELLEHTQVYDDFKGIPKEQIRQALASGKDVVLRLDVQGAATVHSLCPEAVLIFINPGSEAELVSRLTGRHTDTPESVKIRLDTAHQEIGRVREFDYLVVNHDGRLEEAVDNIVDIINAEHHRVNQRKACL